MENDGPGLVSRKGLYSNHNKEIQRSDGESNITYLKNLTTKLCGKPEQEVMKSKELQNLIQRCLLKNSYKRRSSI